MLHPRLTPVGATIGGTSSEWLASIGPTGSWGDLTVQTRWGEGACGMFEASWRMPLPPGFEHPLLRRGTIVEVMGGPLRIGSPLVMAEPGRGSGVDEPWTISCTGIGREVEGENAFYCLDSSGNTTSVASTAVDQAIVRGLRWAGRDATVPSAAFGATSSTADLNTVGALFNSIAESGVNGIRWGVGQDNIVGFKDDPTTPTYHVTPGTAQLGTADDDYATVVLLRYRSSTTGKNETAVSPSTASAVEQRFGRREYAVPITDHGPIDAATAQLFADGILARSKGRLAWVGGLTVTSNEILTSGGVPADLSKVAEDVGNGCMVRIHGAFSDLLESTGETYLDVILGEAKYTDGAPTLDLSPMGLAPRDLASVVESVTGYRAAA